MKVISKQVHFESDSGDILIVNVTAVGQREVDVRFETWSNGYKQYEDVRLSDTIYLDRISNILISLGLLSGFDVGEIVNFIYYSECYHES